MQITNTIVRTVKTQLGSKWQMLHTHTHIGMQQCETEINGSYALNLNIYCQIILTRSIIAAKT